MSCSDDLQSKELALLAEFSDPLTQGDQTRPDFDRTLRPSCVQTLRHVRLQPSRRLIKCPDSCLHNDNSSPPRSRGGELLSL